MQGYITVKTVLTLVNVSQTIISKYCRKYVGTDKVKLIDKKYYIHEKSVLIDFKHRLKPISTFSTPLVDNSPQSKETSENDILKLTSTVKTLRIENDRQANEIQRIQSEFLHDIEKLTLINEHLKKEIYTLQSIISDLKTDKAELMQSLNQSQIIAQSIVKALNK